MRGCRLARYCSVECQKVHWQKEQELHMSEASDDEEAEEEEEREKEVEAEQEVHRMNKNAKQRQ